MREHSKKQDARPPGTGHGRKQPDGRNQHSTASRRLQPGARDHQASASRKPAGTGAVLILEDGAHPHFGEPFAPGEAGRIHIKHCAPDEGEPEIFALLFLRVPQPFSTTTLDKLFAPIQRLNPTPQLPPLLSYDGDSIMTLPMPAFSARLLAVELASIIEERA